MHPTCAQRLACYHVGTACLVGATHTEPTAGTDTEGSKRTTSAAIAVLHETGLRSLSVGPRKIRAWFDTGPAVKARVLSRGRIYREHARGPRVHRGPRHPGDPGYTWGLPVYPLPPGTLGVSGHPGTRASRGPRVYTRGRPGVPRSSGRPGVPGYTCAPFRIVQMHWPT